MHPILFHVSGFPVHTYSLVFASVIMTGVIVCLRRARLEGRDERRFFNALTIAIVGMMFFSKGLDVLVSWRWYFEEPRRLLDLGYGHVFYGGYIGAVVFPLLYLRLVREPILPLMDIAATYLPAGLAAHRAFGCLSAGCCYGRPTDAPWGIVFPADSMPAGAYGQVPLHPTQLYEAGLGLCMFAVLLYWRKHRRVAAGELFALQMAMYAVGRFIIEIYRGDLERGRFGPLTTSQWISVIMLVVAAGLAAHAWRERRAVKGAT